MLGDSELKQLSYLSQSKGLTTVLQNIWFLYKKLNVQASVDEMCRREMLTTTP